MCAWLASGDSSVSVQISSQPVSVSVVPTSVPVHGITQLGFSSHLTGLSAPETTSTTFLYSRTFRPVYATAWIRPNGRCQPMWALAGPIFSYLRNPYLTLPVQTFTTYTDASIQRWGNHIGFPDIRYLDPGLGYRDTYRPYRLQAPYQLLGTQNGIFGVTPLSYSASGPPGYDCYRQHYSSFYIY